MLNQQTKYFRDEPSKSLLGLNHLAFREITGCMSDITPVISYQLDASVNIAVGYAASTVNKQNQLTPASQNAIAHRASFPFMGFKRDDPNRITDGTGRFSCNHSGFIQTAVIHNDNFSVNLVLLKKRLRILKIQSDLRGFVPNRNDNRQIYAQTRHPAMVCLT
jgi:hypothetical protein